MVLKANAEDPFRPIVRIVQGMSAEEDRLRLVNLTERDPKSFLRSAVERRNPRAVKSRRLERDTLHIRVRARFMPPDRVP